MGLRLTQLNEANHPAFEALLAQSWQQSWGAELARDLIRWRYYDRPSGGGTWLARNGDRCVAMVDSYLRPYLLDGRRILVREGCDWFCLPKYRALGLGVRLMQKLMAAPEPMLSIGGTDATLSILPRLGWDRLPDVECYFLPIKARSFAGAMLRSRWPAAEPYAMAIPRFISVARPRPSPAPPIGASTVTEWRPGVSPVAPAHKSGLVQLLDRLNADWIAQMPRDVAEVVGLTFFLDGRLVGCSWSQIEPAVTGLDGRMVHLQISHAAQSIVDWVVAETASRLAARGVGIIRCLASSPEKIEALRKCGFLLRKTFPSYWWPKPEAPAPAMTDVGYLRADDAIPFPALHGRHLVSSPRSSHRDAAATAASA